MGSGTHQPLMQEATQANEADASGNPKLPEIGLYMKNKLLEAFKKQNQPIQLKYIDPSYMVRSTSASRDDRVYCLTLAQNVVHGAMAGFTGFTVGTVNNRSSLIPMHVITSSSPCKLNPRGRTWERVLSITHQPHFLDI